MYRMLTGILAVILLLIAVRGPAPAEEKKDYPITPVPFTKVKVADAFWLPRR